MILCYIPMLEGQAPEVSKGLEALGQKYGIVPMLLPPVRWNDDLTPWPAAPIFRKGKPFGGKASAYLKELEERIIPSMEKGEAPEERWLLGVSLAGLFAVWAGVQSPLFTRIGAISGSFWFDAFPQWLQAQSPAPQLLSAYISLGNQEAEGKNPRLKTIADDTAAVVRLLREKGIPTTFESTAGTHFAPLLPRIDQALAGLKCQKKEAKV